MEMKKGIQKGIAKGGGERREQDVMTTGCVIQVIFLSLLIKPGKSVSLEHASLQITLPSSLFN